MTGNYAQMKVRDCEKRFEDLYLSTLTRHNALYMVGLIDELIDCCVYFSVFFLILRSDYFIRVWGRDD